MTKKKYKFTAADLKLKRHLEKKRGGKIPDEEFYKYILKLRKWLKEYVKVIKKWCIEKPVKVERFLSLMRRIEERERNKKLYEKLAKIKKLTVAGLQKLLATAIKKEGYTNLEFSNSEIKRDVILEFTAQDTKIDRGKYDSRIQLQRLIKKSLKNINWRLMSDGVDHRLGILSGRLRGYEFEEDLLKIIKTNQK